MGIFNNALNNGLFRMMFKPLRFAVKEEIPREWLVKRVTLEEARKEETYQYRSDIDGPEKTGNRDDSLIPFARKMRTGDELWLYDSGKNSWQALAGRHGYAIVRNGKIIDEIQLYLS